MLRSGVSENGFERRLYGEGVTDSICLHCHSTVASTASEKELQDAEAEHDCWMRREARRQPPECDAAGQAERIR
jgi:hypothetical protein